mmetsp:Transcript_8724/g.12679  ORF Transcript_8724/g.12679 Transcript_8724/m.12679 type:complete len:713 (-) Transcript_8724:109-2247(-)
MSNKSTIDEASSSCAVGSESGMQNNNKNMFSNHDIDIECPNPGTRINASPNLEKSTTKRNKSLKTKSKKKKSKSATKLEKTCSICNVDKSIVQCSGPEPHGQCLECFNGYAKANFELNREYERERVGISNQFSKSGQLPCPYFIEGTCDCAEMSPVSLRKHLDEQAFQMWRKADTRIALTTADKSRKEAQAAKEDIQEQQSPLANLKDQVLEALTQGSMVCCPQCSTQGEKDDQCMHIKCEACETHFCYCCGRKRGSDRQYCSRQHGCDSITPYLENNPGWNRFALSEETRGQGALNEFHRRRMAYFIKQIKQRTDDALWLQLESHYPRLLGDVPTPGRRIEWDSIDYADAPTFGLTRPHEVKWADEEPPNLDNERLFQEQTWNLNRLQSRRLAFSRFLLFIKAGMNTADWLFVACNVFIILGLLLAAPFAQNETAQVSILVGLCCYISLALLPLLSFLIDRRAVFLLNDLFDLSASSGEVIFCGSRQEVPYLSSNGRWKKIRWIYLVFLSVTFTTGMCLSLVSWGWNEQQCREHPTFCGLGPSILLFSFMVFGFGTFLVNLSPPPEIDPAIPIYIRRVQNRWYWNLGLYFIFAGVFIPVGVFAMENGRWSKESSDAANGASWAMGAIIFCTGFSSVLGDFSHRLVHPHGFDLGQGRFLPSVAYCAFWLFLTTGSLLVAYATPQANSIAFALGVSFICYSLISFFAVQVLYH